MVLLWPILASSKPKLSLRGAGASFPNEVYQAWMTYYTTTRLNYVSLHMSYDAVGSGTGKRRITGQEGPRIDYGGSDSLLSEDVKEEFPDIRMFPTMAGAVVIGYNIPKLHSRLVLSIPVLVSIYNGSITHWDDPRLTILNPETTFPKQRIKVLARADKSGTTSIFTSALSNEDSWRYNYGIFSQGEFGSKWPNDTITYFAHQNRGMSGLILSFRYSIGYISIADAKESDVRSALLHTNSATVVEANTSTVQLAMHEAAKHLTNAKELTTSLAQYSTRQSYPIAGLTYMIVYMTSMTNCDVALELVRYINWFLTSEEAYRICVDNNMTPLSKELAKVVSEKIVKQMSCKGDNLWQRARIEMDLEQRPDNKLLLVSVGLTTGIVLFGFTAIGIYFLSKRIKFMRKLSEREWEVNIEDILFYQVVRSGEEEEKRFVLWPSMTSLTEVDQIEDGFMILEHILHWPGKWQGITIGLRLLEIRNLKLTSQATQATLLWLKDISHANILKFYGITTLDKNHFIVSDYCSKGSLGQMLKDKKLNLTNDFKFELSLDVANGLTFLHSKDIVHGHLRSTNCLLDLRWTVKISDWEYFRLHQKIDKKTPFSLLRSQTVIDNGQSEIQDLWTAPEILKSGHNQNPTFSSDVFSFSIILFEIYSRKTPYTEYLNELPVSQILKSITKQGLRPRDDCYIPDPIRSIMSQAWSDDVHKRPTIDQVVKLLRGLNSSRKSAVNTMLEVTEIRSVVLENQLKSLNNKMKELCRVTKGLVERQIPTIFHNCFIDRLTLPDYNTDPQPAGRTITAFAAALWIQLSVCCQVQWTTLNRWYALLDNLLEKHDGTRVDLSLGSSIVLFFRSDSEHEMPKPKSSDDASGGERTIDSSETGIYQRAAKFSLELTDCNKCLFVRSKNEFVNGMKIAIHQGLVDVYLLDNVWPKCFFLGHTLETLRNMINYAVTDKVMVSSSFGELLDREGLSYHFEPNDELNETAVATFFLSENPKDSKPAAAQVHMLPVIV
ncbi:hypothetical protein LSH36_219g04001 [Paralvinella palmiformis]|uniref:Protein kinase domain-containing protein n=1 Tax=Paralvinella palmiformis TaxID=53620 RepID=A0AAD9JNX6_9ANNE|nr:hypothetical protein LSH36_219g04001 [Paralvinella palmiformis]